MNDTLFSFCANIFGFIAGGISLVGFVVAVCCPHLPSNKIKILETLLHETASTFNEAVEAGLPIPDFIDRTNENLAGLKEQTCNLRARAHNATTLARDYVESLRGTSSAIGRTYQSMRRLRAEIITSSEERRHEVLRTLNPRSVPPADYPIQWRSTPSFPTSITRPRSCPPILSSWNPADVQNIPVGIRGPFSQTSVHDISYQDTYRRSHSNPFGDPSRSDEDVRTVDVQL